MVKHNVEEITLNARGNSLENAFIRIAAEMFNIVLNTEEIDPIVTKTIIIRARDLKNLLYQFMKRLFYLANIELFVLSNVKQITIERISNEYLLNAILIGDKMNERYQIKDVVKQITDRNISIKEDREGTSLQINIVVERRNIKDEV